MAQGNITKTAVDEMIACDRDSFLWDNSLKGFGLKVTPAGKKVYLFQYRVKGKIAPVRVTLGEHGGFDTNGDPMTPDRARRSAQVLSGQVAAGKDPVSDERAKKSADDQAKVERDAEAQRLLDLNSRLLVGTLADRFLAEYVAVKKPRSYRFYEPLFRLHIKPAIGDIPMPELTGNHIDELIARIPAEQAVNRRNVFMAAARLWNWTAKRKRGSLPAASPFATFDRPEPAKSRERVLNDDELVAIWNAAGAMPYPFAFFFRLLAVTGQRRDEVAGMGWNELNRKLGIWELDGGRVKNAKDHTVALAPLAVQLLDELAGGPDWPKSGLVLTTTGRTAISGFSGAKKRLDLLVDAIHPEMPDWRVHDLRRTMATGYQKLDVRFEVTEAALNHVSGSRAGVAGIYGRHKWQPGKISAARLWAAHVQAILAGYREGQLSIQDPKSVPDIAKLADEWRGFVAGWAERNGPPRDNVTELPIRNQGAVPPR